MARGQMIYAWPHWQAVASKDGAKSPQTESEGKDIVVGGTTVCDMANRGIERQGCKGFVSADEPGSKRGSRESVCNVAVACVVERR